MPTVTINSDRFAPLGQRTAIAGGMPYLPILTTKHPVAYLSDEEIRERANALLNEVVHVLTTSAERLQEEYLMKEMLEKRPRSSTPG